MSTHALTEQAVVLRPEDDVAIAKKELAAGIILEDGPTSIVVRGDIKAGHKIARRAVRAGDPVRRYGQIIGFASRDIAVGDHVHTHNLGIGELQREYEFCTDVRPVDYYPPGRSWAVRSSRRSWRWPRASGRRASSPASARRSSRPGSSARCCRPDGAGLTLLPLLARVLRPGREGGGTGQQDPAHDRADQDPDRNPQGQIAVRLQDGELLRRQTQAQPMPLGQGGEQRQSDGEGRDQEVADIEGSSQPREALGRDDRRHGAQEHPQPGDTVGRRILEAREQVETVGRADHPGHGGRGSAPRSVARRTIRPTMKSRRRSFSSGLILKKTSPAPPGCVEWTTAASTSTGDAPGWTSNSSSTTVPVSSSASVATLHPLTERSIVSALAGPGTPRNPTGTRTRIPSNSPRT